MTDKRQQPGEAAGPDRRAVLRGVGAAGAGLVGMAALAACGSSGGSGAGGGAGGAEAPTRTTIKESEVPVGGGAVVASARVVVTQPKAGDYKAFSAICTHEQCIVGSVQGGTINCPCHGSRFNMSTGAVEQGPATQPLPARTVTVSSGSVTVS